MMPAVVLSSMIGLLVFDGVLFMEAGFPEPQSGQTIAQLTLVVMLTPFRILLSLHPMGLNEVLVIVAALVLWLAAQIVTWHWRLLERYFALPDGQ